MFDDYEVLGVVVCGFGVVCMVVYLDLVNLYMSGFGYVVFFFG